MRASRGAKPLRRGLGDGPETGRNRILTSPHLPSPPLTSKLRPQSHPPNLPPRISPPPHLTPPTYLTPHPVDLPSHILTSPPHHPNDYLTSPLTSPPRMTSYPPRIPTSPSPDLLPPSPTPSFRKEHSDLLSSTRPTEPGTYPTPPPRPTPRPNPRPPRTYLRYLPPRRLSLPLVSRLPKSPQLTQCMTSSK